ncbi:MAG: DUF1640 domain-containing protein [Methylobacter sp.]|nr:DUF1640 domain-containing protein [Methylobacter sp.]
MTAITFDTYKFIRTLKAAGVPEGQAEAFSEAFKEAQGEAELATQHDITDVRRDIRELEQRLESKIDKVTSDLKVDLIKWVTGALIAQAAVIATLVKLL